MPNGPRYAMAAPMGSSLCARYASQTCRARRNPTLRYKSAQRFEFCVVLQFLSNDINSAARLGSDFEQRTLVRWAVGHDANSFRGRQRQCSRYPEVSMPLH